MSCVWYVFHLKLLLLSMTQHSQAGPHATAASRLVWDDDPGPVGMGSWGSLDTL
jgi:hypothetical protein